MGTKTAMIAVVGRPNVGKSTLTNLLTGEKVAIVSPKPQTTRNRIFGVFMHGDTQMILLDTPGFHKARTRLGDYMVGVVRESVADVDAAALVVEPVDNIGTQEEMLIAHIEASGVPAVLVINKIDTVNPGLVLPIIERYSQRYEFGAIVPVSAKTGDGSLQLLDVLERYAQDGPLLFPVGVVTDQPEKQVIAELIREKLLICLDKEIPHGTAVVITQFSERGAQTEGAEFAVQQPDDGPEASQPGNLPGDQPTYTSPEASQPDTESGDNCIIDVEATIYCEKASHKGMIIGKNGAMLKKIGSLAREDIEHFMGAKVYLQTWVKVKQNWRDNQSMIRNLGYKSGGGI